MSSAVATTSRRPERPRRSWRVPASVVLFLLITWWAGSSRFGIGFSPARIVDGLSRAGGIVSDFLSPQWQVLDNTIGPFLETLRMAVIGSVIGCSIALVIAFLASRATASSNRVYLSAKAFLNVIRALPDILYALIFVAAFGIGALPGVLALLLFDIGVVAKLLSETVDGIDPGPGEAATAAGATRLQLVRAAVLPQVLPNYIAYSLYAFELNLRASTVLGLVGAGGIGQTINLYRQRFLYGHLTVIIVEIFVIVFVVEFISINIRRRLV